MPLALTKLCDACMEHRPREMFYRSRVCHDCYLERKRDKSVIYDRESGRGHVPRALIKRYGLKEINGTWSIPDKIRSRRRNSHDGVQTEPVVA
jgi:hypothetical protein